jgi:hypothetical protein
MTLVLPEMRRSPDIPICYPYAAAELEKGIAPGEVVELKVLSGQFYDWLKASIARETTLSAITTARIRDTLAKLPDGTLWVSECVNTAKPDNQCPNLGRGLNK